MSKVYMDLSLFRVEEGFRGRSAWLVQLWWVVQAVFFRPSPQFLYGWRRFLLRLFGAKIGKKVIIRPSVRTVYPWKVSVGDYSWIGDDVVLYSLGEIEIGAHSVVSQQSYLCAATHDYRDTSFPLVEKKIKIHGEVWLAAGVFVHPGVEIAKGVIVGARSVVTENLDEAIIYIGHPAKAVKER